MDFSAVAGRDQSARSAGQVFQAYCDRGGDELQADVRKLIVETIIGDVFDVSFDALRGGTRGCAKVAFARQVAMYLAHVHFGMTLTEVGRMFKRDRTTVAHACALVEDRRDATGFDHVMDLLERILAQYDRQRAGADLE